MASGQAAAVRSLYRNILLLHRYLPLELKAVGDEYVRAEFRRHKTAKPEEVKTFMQEWMNYAALLRDQLQRSDPVTGGGGPTPVGRDLAENRLDDLSQEQMGQLYELRKETAKPSPFVPPEGAP